ncbi:MAG: hypothetical protein ABR953_08395 [Candidatus Acidiferrales bacterium]|jgi:hypothetical protein
MNRKLLVISFAAALFALPASAQQGSKLNGTWKLNVASSSFGQFPPPQSETDVIEINGTDFQQHVTSETARGAQSYTRACTIDGKEVSLSPDDPRAHLGAVVLSKIQCSWDGNSLVAKETANVQGAELTDTFTFSASDDAKTLTATSQIRSASISGDRKFVYDRAEGAATSSTASPMAVTPGAAAMIHTGSSTPDLSGTWKLNAEKSNFGQMPPPASQVDTIQHVEPSIKIALDQKGGMMGDMAYSESLTTDGKEATWPGMGGAEVKGMAHWEGNALVVDAKSSFQGSDVKIKETYTISADGKTLTEVSHVETSMGNFDTTNVFDKQ